MKQNITNRNCSDNQPIVEARRPPGYNKYELRKYTYNLPESIAPSEIKKTFNTEIVVIGAGTSGKAAALSAAEKGAQVIQIDRHVTFRWSGGQIASVGNRVQKAAGIKVDVDEMCRQLVRWGGNYPDQRLYRLWAEKSGEALDWVMDMTDAEGIKTVLYQWPRPASYDASKEYYPDFPVTVFQNLGYPMDLDHSLALKTLEKHALKRGVDIRYQTRAMQLVRSPNGRVSAVIAMNKDGQYEQYNASKAVIMCTGDYGNNPWMMQKYCPHGVEPALTNNIYMTRNEDLRVAPEPLDTGDGHQMVMKIGGVMQSSPHAPMSHSNAGPIGNAPFLRVNILGERFENEDVTAQSISNSVATQPQKKAWQVFDSKWQSELKYMGIGLGRFPVATPKMLAALEQACKADTIEELAQKMNVPVKNFKATIDRYNQLARQGHDSDFGKMPERLTTIDKPPFYAGMTERLFLVVLGGINCNMQMQPLDEDWKPIPGLYLAGNMVGNRFSLDYPVMCPGLSHSLAYVTGRLAGQTAAAEKG